MHRNNILLALFAMIVAGSTVGAVMSQRQAPEQVIKVAFLASKDDEDYDGALVFKEVVESRTNRRVVVEIYPSGQFCGNERECIEALQSGVLEVHMTTVGGVGNLFPPVQVLDLPYAFSGDAEAECVLDGPVIDHLRTVFLERALGMRLMVVGNTGGWRNFATADRLVRTPDDLDGLKIRTTPAAIQQELVKQLGGNPTPVAWPEVYSALATGVVEGTKNSVQDIVGMNFHEHVGYIALDGHSYMSALWWYSERGWQRLDPELRQIVFEAFQKLKTVTRALPLRRQIEANEAFEAGGGTIYTPTEEEKARFVEAANGMRTWFAETYGREWLDRLDTAVNACARERESEFEKISR